MYSRYKAPLAFVLILFNVVTLDLSSSLLHESYQSFLDHIVTIDGRVVRPLNDNDTVSEGQAYGMLIALWMDDQSTFDTIYSWTEDNLSRVAPHEDHLLAWHWKEGEVVDWTPASDADADYAYALLLAYDKWKQPLSANRPSYRDKARLILHDILEKETLLLPFGRIQLPGTWGLNANNTVTWNPSYFSPAWCRRFAMEGFRKEWEDLLGTGYKLLEAVQTSLDDNPGVGLFPDWCSIDERMQVHSADGFATAQSWDAFRVAWRLQRDWMEHQEFRAYHCLSRHHQFYMTRLNSTSSLAISYSYDGTVLSNESTPCGYVPLLVTSIALNKHTITKQILPVIQGDLPRIDPIHPYYGTCWQILALISLATSGQQN